jgi:hypothetical protein
VVLNRTNHTIQCHTNHVFHPTTNKYVRITCLHSNKQQYGFNTYITSIMINNITLLIIPSNTHRPCTQSPKPSSLLYSIVSSLITSLKITPLNYNLVSKGKAVCRVSDLTYSLTQDTDFSVRTTSTRQPNRFHPSFPPLPT